MFMKEINYMIEYGFIKTVDLLFEEAIERLLGQKRIHKTKPDVDEYTNATKAKVELDAVQINFDRVFQSIIDTLFKDASGKVVNYHEPFWFTMSYIFSNIGELSAKLIEGKIDKNEILRPVFQRCLKLVKKKFTIDYYIFEKKIIFSKKQHICLQ